MEIFFIFLLGLAVGSFLNVLIDRLPRDESIVKGRSYCESCKKKLHWKDLIPVFSYVLLKGRCRYCHSPISFYYPIVELATGVLFVAMIFYLSQLNFKFQISNFKYITDLFYYLFITSSLIVIFFTDLKYGIIPDKILYPLILITLLLQITNYQLLITNYLLSAIGAFLFFLVLLLITKGKGMGFGDVKLAFFMGIFLGFPKIIIALYASFLTGALVSLILILWGKKEIGGTIPFGPFLVLGTFISLFWGEKIMGLLL